jgi:glycosyltransferase involved in cell wall biosynthesis
MTADMPAVALDVSVARFNRAGSGSYARWLALGLAPVMGRQFRTVEIPGAIDRSSLSGWRRRLETLRHDLWWTQRGVIRAARRARADLLHVPTVLAPATSPLPLVVTIHDVSVLNFPDRFPRWFRTWAALTLPRIAAGAALIVTDSSASRDDLLQRWPSLEGRVAVVPLGIPPRDASWRDPERIARVRREYDLDRPFVLTVGSIEPRKNLPRLLTAIHQLRQVPATREIRLVHVGPSGWLADDVHRLVRDLGLESAVTFVGYVPEHALPLVYGLARVMAYPSLFEGFGLPIVEAMASGCPVVTSSVSSMPEVAGNAALLVDPMDVDGIAEAVGRLWVDEARRRECQSAGHARAAQFTLDRMARDTLDAYHRVAATRHFQA